MKYSLIILLISTLILLTNALPLPVAVQYDSNEQEFIGVNNEETELVSNEDSLEDIANESLNVDISGENNDEMLDENEADEALIKDSTDETLDENESDEKLWEDGIEENNDDDEVDDDVLKENIVESTVNEGKLAGGESGTAVNVDELEKTARDDEIVKDDSPYSKNESTPLLDETLKVRHKTEKGGTNLDVFDEADDLGEDNHFESNNENDNNNNNDEGDELESDDNESKAGLLISVKGKDSENSEEDDDGEYVTEIVEFTEIVGGNYSGEVDVVMGDNDSYDQKESLYGASSSDINTDKETKLVGTEVIIEETKLDDKDDKSTKKSGHLMTTTHSNDDSENAYNGEDSSAGETKMNDSKNNKEKYKTWKDTYQYSLIKDFSFEGSSEPKALRQSLIIKNGGLPYRNLPDYIKQDLLKRMPTQNYQIQQLQNQFGNGAKPSIDSINNALEQILTVKEGSLPKLAAWCCPNSMTLRGYTCQNGVNKVPAQYFSHLTYFKFKDLICETGRPPAEVLGLVSGPMHHMIPEPGGMLRETPGAIQGVASGIEPGTISAMAPGPKLGSALATLLGATLNFMPINALETSPGAVSGAGPVVASRAPVISSGAVSGAGPVVAPLTPTLLTHGGNPRPMSEDFMMGIQPWPVQDYLNVGLLSRGPTPVPGGSLPVPGGLLPHPEGPLAGAEGHSDSGGIKFGAADSPSSKFDPDLNIQKEILEGEVIPWPGDSATGFDKLIDIMSSMNEVSIQGNDVAPLGKPSYSNVTPNLIFGGMPITGKKSLIQDMIPPPTNNFIPRTDAMTSSGIPMSFLEGLKHSLLSDSSRSGVIPLANKLYSGSSSAGMKVGSAGISSPSQITRTNHFNTLNSQGLVSSTNGNIQSGLGSSTLTHRMSADDPFVSQPNIFNPGAGAVSSMDFYTKSGGSLTDNSLSGYGSPISMNLISGMSTSSLVNKIPQGFETPLIYQQSNLMPNESLSWGGHHSDSQFPGSLLYRDGEEEWIEDTFDSQELLDHQSIDWINEDLESKDYTWVPNDEHHIYDNLIQGDSYPKQNELNNLIVPVGSLDYTLQDGVLLNIPEGLQADMLTNPFIENDYFLQKLNENIIPGNVDLQNTAGQQQLVQNSG